MRVRSGFVLLIAGLALVLGGAILVWRNLPTGPSPAGEVPRVLEAPTLKSLPPFRLEGTRGEFRNAQLAGHWTFLFFGYTQCPDICPSALALMKEVRSIVQTTTPSLAFDVVFVSVDPKRDTPALLGQYLAAFDPGFIGVSGDDLALQPLTRALGVTYRRNDEKDHRNYTVDHSASIHLIDQQGRPVASFPPPQAPAALAADLRRFALR